MKFYFFNFISFCSYIYYNIVILYFHKNRYDRYMNKEKIIIVHYMFAFIYSFLLKSFKNGNSL